MRVLASSDAFPLIECSSLGFAANGPDQERRNRFLPDSAPLDAERQYAWRDQGIRVDHDSPSRFRRRGRCRIYLYRGPQRRIGSRYSPAGNSRIDRESGGRRYRSDLAARLVGAALRRAWWGFRPGTLGARHRAVGFEGAARQSAALALVGWIRSPRTLLRRWHRSRSF